MHRTLMGALLLSCVGCTGASDTLWADLPSLFPENSPEAAGMLAFVNDPDVDVALLDDVVPLDQRAAKAIIAHRDGTDAMWGTADDDYFDTLRELDDTPFVGESALEAMFDYAWLHGWMEDVLRGFDGVGFTPSEARGTLWVANDLSFERLDEELSLDRRAASAIVEARPIRSMDQLAAVDYVGEATLRRLRDAAWIDSDWE
ncbi:MAG: hypothetical protein EP330_21820 [Deltaproteobacteria bacterium]|nr:MAG: hypothetical protein EP330_21820 [Deltaproteobacteria bacterium]